MYLKKSGKSEHIIEISQMTFFSFVKFYHEGSKNTEDIEMSPMSTMTTFLQLCSKLKTKFSVDIKYLNFYNK